jgi:hypothetical protein
VDGHTPQPDEVIESGAFVTLPRETDKVESDPKPSADLHMEQHGISPPRPVCSVILNGATITLPPKADGTPPFVMDLLERTGIDFKQAQRPIILRVNGAECQFQQELKNGDRVEIGYEDTAVEV